MRRSIERRRRLTRSLLLAATLYTAACTEAPQANGVTTLERARNDAVLRVGFANEPPYAYAESGSGRLTGESPEIARAILAELGVGEIEGVLTEFGSLIPGLKAGRFDMIAAGMYILPERCREIGFSNPTYAVGEAFIVPRGNPLDLHSYEDVARHPEARLGIVAGAVEREYARATGIPDERVVVFPDTPSALEGVLAGRADAYAGTSLTVNSLLARAKSEKLERAAPFSDPMIAGKRVRGYGAFGFRKDDVKLMRAFNAALARYIGTPAHLEAVEPFGFTAAELPGSVSARDLCQG